MGDAPRVAVVTGASSGIGAAVARALGARGWSVALGARNEERLAAVAREVETAGGKAFARRLDVTDPTSIDAFFEAAERALGPVDVLVSSAGLCLPGAIHERSAEDLRREADTNLLGALWMARRTIAALLDRGASGDLVFVSSDHARAPRPFQTVYNATKCAVEAMARSLALELEGTGIRSTVVRPGPTQTELERAADPGLIRRLLTSWRRFGLQRQLVFLPTETVANAVVTAVTQPEGAHLDFIQVQPQSARAEPAAGVAPEDEG